MVKLTDKFHKFHWTDLVKKGEKVVTSEISLRLYKKGYSRRVGGNLRIQKGMIL